MWVKLILLWNKELTFLRQLDLKESFITVCVATQSLLVPNDISQNYITVVIDFKKDYFAFCEILYIGSSHYPKETNLNLFSPTLYPYIHKLFVPRKLKQCDAFIFVIIWLTR